MAVPTTITDLSVTAASNVPAGTDTVTTTTGPDEYFRALSAILRMPQAKGADVASASASGLGSNTDGDYFHVTGTTGIAASNFGTVSAGIEKTIVFDGALTLTHNATSFILPGGANITTAAGDVAVFRSEGSGNWKCTHYIKASGAPIGSYQPLDATLTALAAVLTAANKIPYATALNTAGELDLSTSTSLGTSDTTLSSQKAVKTYVDKAVAGVSTLTAGTAQASTSGTSIDFTGIPAGTKRITVMFNGVSTNGTSNPQVQLGTGSPTTTGYTGYNARQAATSNAYVANSSGFILDGSNGASTTLTGHLVATLISGNTWICSGIVTNSAAVNESAAIAGTVALAGTLDRIRITTVSGTDAFDAGSINILYE